MLDEWVPAQSLSFQDCHPVSYTWQRAFHQARLPNMPYGGYKQSGIGRELGRHGLDEYLEVKAIQIKLG